MILAQDHILSVLPHRPPFVMISNLLKAERDAFDSDFEITGQTLFVENGYLTEPALIENVAQTCAAGFGYRELSAEGKPKLGFIGAISKLELFHLPKVGSRIITKVLITHQLGSVFLAKGENFEDGVKLMECEVKIVISE